MTEERKLKFIGKTCRSRKWAQEGQVMWMWKITSATIGYSNKYGSMEVSSGTGIELV